MTDVSIERYETGVPGLDQLLAGGLPKSRVTLLAGRSGTCKTVSSLQIACAAAARGERVLFISVEEAVDDLVATGESFDLGTRRLVEEGLLKIADLAFPVEGPVLMSGNFDIHGLASRIRHLISQQDCTYVFIDSLSALFAPAPASLTLRHQVSFLLSELAKDGRTVVVTSESGPREHAIGSIGVEEYLCDAVLVLRNVRDGKRRRKSIEVHKYRRSNHYKGEFPCALTSEGLVVFPLDTSPREPSDVTERVASGIEGLDRITRGGWMRDSIALVRGPSGSGKTILSASYAVAGAQRGERVFYYGFEETEGMLLRNIEALNLPMRKYVESGSLKLTCRFPESTSPEDMIVELRQVLARHQPTLIVIDSISAIEHVLSYESFRHFTIGITSALREHGRSALLTQAVVPGSPTEQSAPYLSTMADAILNITYDLEPNRLRRLVRVVKMRGSAHETGAVPFQIGANGISIGE